MTKRAQRSARPSSWGASSAKEITLGSAFGSGGRFTAVSCSSASSCVAAGTADDGEPLSLSGNPASWGTAQAKKVVLGASFGYITGSSGNWHHQSALRPAQSPGFDRAGVQATDCVKDVCFAGGHSNGGLYLAKV